MASELAYKRAFRASVGWSTAVEPGRGSDTGASDLLVLLGDRLVPVELKTATQHGPILKVDKPGIRPSQVSWHFALWRAGGFSLFAFGVPWEGTWLTHLYRGNEIAGWRDGLEFRGEMTLDNLEMNLKADLSDWLRSKKAP